MKLLLALTLAATPLPAYAQSAPPPNWEMTLPGARQFGKDVCTERDELRSDRACYAAYLRQQDINRGEDRAARRAIALEGGYPPGDDRCTLTYQLRTRWGYWADDESNCRGRLRRNIHWITLEEICQSADAGPDEMVLVTDEIHPPLECPPELEDAP